MTNDETSRLGYDATYLFCSLNSFWHIFRLAVCRFVWSIKIKNKIDGEKIILFLSIRLPAIDFIIHTHTHIHISFLPATYGVFIHKAIGISLNLVARKHRAYGCVLMSTRSIIDHEMECEKNYVRTRTAFTLANGQFVCVACFVFQNAENRLKHANSHLFFPLCEPIEWMRWDNILFNIWDERWCTAQPLLNTY